MNMMLCLKNKSIDEKYKITKSHGTQIMFAFQIIKIKVELNLNAIQFITFFIIPYSSVILHWSFFQRREKHRTFFVTNFDGFLFCLGFSFSLTYNSIYNN